MTSKDDILRSDKFREILAIIKEKYSSRIPDESIRKTRLEHELRTLQDNRSGWNMSLANTQLDPDVRRELEEQLKHAINRTREIEHELSEISVNANQKRDALDPNVVAENLMRLGELMEGDNAAAANVMLAQHIDAIACDKDGRVVVRSCLLGALADPERIAQRLQSGAPGETGTRPGRRRSRRDLGAHFEDDDEALAVNDFAVNPERYAELGPEWFTDDVFEVPGKQSWVETHAREVAEYRQANSPTMEVLAARFGKSVPTIRSALRYAKTEYGIDVMGKEISLSTRQNWSRDNALPVAEFFRQSGATMSAAVKFFGKSEPTISKARKFAEQMLEGESAPTLREAS